MQPTMQPSSMQSIFIPATALNAGDPAIGPGSGSASPRPTFLMPQQQLQQAVRSSPATPPAVIQTPPMFASAGPGSQPRSPQPPSPSSGAILMPQQPMYVQQGQYTQQGQQAPVGSYVFATANGERVSVGTSSPPRVLSPASMRLRAAGHTVMTASHMYHSPPRHSVVVPVQQTVTLPAPAALLPTQQVVTQVQQTVSQPLRRERKVVTNIIKKTEVRYVDRLVEVSVVQVVDKVVPKATVKEVLREVPKVEVKEVVKTVPKIVEKIVPKYEYDIVKQYVDKVVEIPDVREETRVVETIQIQEVPVERIVEVPRVHVKERVVVKEVPKTVIVEVPVEKIVHVEKEEVRVVEEIRRVEVPQYIDVQRVIQIPKPEYVDVPREILVERPVPRMFATNVEPVVTGAYPPADRPLDEIDPAGIPGFAPAPRPAGFNSLPPDLLAAAKAAQAGPEAGAGVGPGIA